MLEEKDRKARKRSVRARKEGKGRGGEEDILSEETKESREERTKRIRR